MLDKIEIKNLDLRPEITFFRSEELFCISCNNKIVQEELKTGSGRLDAGKLAPDLHRNYLATAEHGEVFPLLYNLITCNYCYTSLFRHDLNKKFRKDSLANIATASAKEERSKILLNLFSKIPDFSKPRDLVSGVAAYILALQTYSQFVQSDIPTIRMAVCTIRTAWLCQELKKHTNNEEVAKLVKIFYKKAYFFYDRAIEFTLNGSEDLMDMGIIGPDVDKDFGYDGVIYLHAWLVSNHGYFKDQAQKEKKLLQVRNSLSKVFGFGRSSKEKPSALLDLARNTFDEIESQLRKLKM